ncbi:hypothetical protein G9A89_010409 [Geosiphon pyriformis]|nr:hypothetical protein G9A89_010409 [Geosiphon pyriformis]
MNFRLFVPQRYISFVNAIFLIILSLQENHDFPRKVFANGILKTYNNIPNIVGDNTFNNKSLKTNNLIKRAIEVPGLNRPDWSFIFFLADMVYYTHQAYCLHVQSGFIDEDIYAWVAPIPQRITLRNGAEHAILIQVRGRELTYERMVQWDQSRAFKTLKRGGFKSWENFKVPLESYERYERKFKSRISDLLEKYVSDKSYKNYGFLFTGHGEGGALATYAALDFWQNNLYIKPSQIEVTTLGAPRLGDEKFVNYISKYLKINRVTYINDFVPLFLGHTFRHPNTEYWMTTDSCECIDQSPLYDCHMKSGTENPICNLRFQEFLLNGKLNETSGTFGSFLDAHNGPYFGYRMKKCYERDAHMKWLAGEEIKPL